MDRNKDDLVLGKSADDLNNVFRIFRGQAGGWFIKEVNIRRTDHVQPNVQAFSLPAAEIFFNRTSHETVAALRKAEFDQLPVDASHAIFWRKMWRTKRRCVIKIFQNSQMLIESVVLRNIRNIFSQGFQVAVERLAIHQDLAM